MLSGLYHRRSQKRSPSRLECSWSEAGNWLVERSLLEVDNVTFFLFVRDFFFLREILTTDDEHFLNTRINYLPFSSKKEKKKKPVKKKNTHVSTETDTDTKKKKK